MVLLSGRDDWAKVVASLVVTPSNSAFYMLPDAMGLQLKNGNR